MSVILSQNGQSVKDISLVVFGNIDNIVQFCIDNNIKDLNYIPTNPTAFTYDSQIKQVSLYSYATAQPFIQSNGSFDGSFFDPNTFDNNTFS